MLSTRQQGSKAAMSKFTDCKSLTSAHSLPPTIIIIIHLLVAQYIHQLRYNWGDINCLTYVSDGSATMTSVTTSQQSLPPATPRYILRGHASAIQALHFFANNSRLISADADGWLVLWDVPSKRARAVWQAHQGAVLEVKGYQTTSHCTTIYSYVLSRSSSYIAKKKYVQIT